jgi:copper chaperone NosL
MKKIRNSSRIIVALISLAMISACYVPLWQILMWAPQYPEGLEMKIWIDDITGDVKIISALNHYIGMRHIEVEMFPEFDYMIYIVSALVGIGLLASITRLRIMLLAFLVAVVASGIAALVDFYQWGYDYGHNLDPTAPIVVPGMSYQPPLIGTKQLLNFTAYSGPDVGGWVFAALGLALVCVVALEFYFYPRSKTDV